MTFNVTFTFGPPCPTFAAVSARNGVCTAAARARGSVLSMRINMSIGREVVQRMFADMTGAQDTQATDADMTP
jgi:hypothetical protein